MAIEWQVQRGMLVSDLTRQINSASRQIRDTNDPLLDHLDTLQRFKRALLRATSENQYLDLAEQWRSTDQHDFEEI